MSTTNWLGVLAVAALAGCGGGPAGEPTAALQRAFPAQAAAVLGQGAGIELVAGAAGFAPRPATAAAGAAGAAAGAPGGGLRATFPLRGAEAVRFEQEPGFAVTVLEPALRGGGRLEGRAAVYWRGAADEAAFWSASEAGFEEWLLGRAPAAGAFATWEVRGGTLRQTGRAVEVLDGEGRPRLRVTAPAAYAATGARLEPQLSVSGQRLELTVPTGGDRSLVLVDPLWQVVPGALTTARVGHSATLLPDGRVLLVGGYDQDIGLLAQAEVYDPGTGRFTATAGSLATPRQYHTATLLKTGLVLVAGGFNFDGTAHYLDDAELFDPAAGRFTPLAANLATGRQKHTATLLASGRVLLIAGEGASGPLASAELFDPGAGTFAPAAGALATARREHTATLLADGTVLVAGGSNPTDGQLDDAETYSPATGTFTATASPLATARERHTASLLPSGEVLIAGGHSDLDFYMSSAELYFPGPRTFVALGGGLVSSRQYHSATLLPSGQVLMVGGSGTGGYRTVSEQYDPTTTTFTATTVGLATARERHTATLLASGEVLVTGGYNGNGARVASAEIFAPQVGTLVTASGSLATPRQRHTATLLPSGKVLIAGGSGASAALATAELYDPGTDGFTPTAAPLVSARYQHTATLLPSGKVLLVGGQAASLITAAELFDPQVGTFAATAGATATARVLHSATLLASGKVVVIGGFYGVAGYASAELYDPATDGFSLAAGSLTTGRYQHTATLLASGKVLVAGGYVGTVVDPRAEVYDPVADSFTPAAGSLATPRFGHTATLLPSGQVLIAGGTNNSGTYPSAAEVYDPTTGAFNLVGAPATPRHWHTATLLPSGMVLIAGGYDHAGNYLTSTELYDPTTGTFTGGGPALATSRRFHTATLLPSGRVLLAGGYGGADRGSAEVYDEGRAPLAAAVPTLDGPLPDVLPGGAFAVTGTLLTGLGEAAGGTCESSATDFPLLLLWRLDNQAPAFAPATAWTASGAAVTVPTTVQPGPHLAWLAVNGVLGAGRPLLVAAAPRGAACAGDYECASRHCADGRCCDTACAAPCDVCAAALGAGADGTCSVAPAGFGGEPTCGPAYACNGSLVSCPTLCTAHEQCAAGHWCITGACVPLRPLGWTCAVGSDCASGECADQVCCSSPCTGNCEVCNAAGHLGECTPVAAGQDPRQRCQAASGGHPDCAGTCDATGQCAFPDTGTVCGTCAVCDGTGRCTVTPGDDEACGVIPCDGLDTACRSYSDVTTSRCASLGVCKAANDPATCTVHSDLPCSDGGTTADAAPPQQQDAGTGGAKSGGCGLAGASRPSAGGALLALLLGLRLRSRGGPRPRRG